MMKKTPVLLIGIMIGALLATAGSAVAAEIKSLIGQKVTGELTVVVNGKELPDKGAVISGRTNVPVRGIADALKAEISLKGSVVTVTTKAVPEVQGTSENSFVGKTKEFLLNAEKQYTTDILPRIQKSIQDTEKSIASLELSVKNGEVTESTASDGLKIGKANLVKLKADEAKYLTTLTQIREALSLIQE